MLPGETHEHMNIDALAEWSWNQDGRDERQFALAWATRQGCAEPERLADWVERMGPVEWDVYDSGFPECYAWGLAARMIEERSKPVLGEGMYRYYRDVADHLYFGEPLSVTPESARRVIALIETAERSSKAGRGLAVPRHCV